MIKNIKSALILLIALSEFFLLTPALAQENIEDIPKDIIIDYNGVTNEIELLTSTLEERKLELTNTTQNHSRITAELTEAKIDLFKNRNEPLKVKLGFRKLVGNLTASLKFSGEKLAATAQEVGILQSRLKVLLQKESFLNFSLKKGSLADLEEYEKYWKEQLEKLEGEDAQIKGDIKNLDQKFNASKKRFKDLVEGDIEQKPKGFNKELTALQAERVKLVAEKMALVEKLEILHQQLAKTQGSYQGLKLRIVAITGKWSVGKFFSGLREISSKLSGLLSRSVIVRSINFLSWLDLILETIDVQRRIFPGRLVCDMQNYKKAEESLPTVKKHLESSKEDFYSYLKDKLFINNPSQLENFKYLTDNLLFINTGEFITEIESVLGRKIGTLEHFELTGYLFRIRQQEKTEKKYQNIIDNPPLPVDFIVQPPLQNA